MNEPKWTQDEATAFETYGGVQALAKMHRVLSRQSEPEAGYSASATPLPTR